MKCDEREKPVKPGTGPQFVVICVLAVLVAFLAGLRVNQSALAASRAKLQTAVAEINRANRSIGELNRRLAAARGTGIPVVDSAQPGATADAKTPETQWSAPGARLMTMHDRNDSDSLTGVLVPTRALCSRMSALASQQQSDCLMARAVGTPYIGYFFDNSEGPAALARTRALLHGSPPPHEQPPALPAKTDSARAKTGSGPAKPVGKRLAGIT